MSWICPCGASNADSNRFCGQCGKQIAQVWGSPTRTRHTLLGKFFGVVGAIACLCVLIGLFFAALHISNSEQQAAAERPAAATATEGPAAGTERREQVQEAPLPVDEAQFISTLASFKEHYHAASNEFLRSTVRRERAAALERILRGRLVDGWIGSVSSMTTTGDGSGVLSIRPPGYDWITVGTWNNSLSDIGSGTLIPAGSPLYEQVSHLSVGGKVTFAGTFGSGDLDYLKESSMTEAGSMDDPEFVFTFASVRAASAPGDQGSSKRTEASAATNAGTPSRGLTQAGPCLSYAPAPVILSGALTSKTFPGRPNFESIEKGDEPETYWILTLGQPICTIQSEDGLNASLYDVSVLQLLVTNAGMYQTYRSLPGTNVKVAGRLFSATTAHHHTPVMLQVISMEPVQIP